MRRLFLFVLALASCAPPAAAAAAAPDWSSSATCPLVDLFGGGGRGPSLGPPAWYQTPAQPGRAGNPLAGRPWFVDCQWDESWTHSRLHQAARAALAGRLVEHIARQPIAKWFGPTHAGMYATVRSYLQRSAGQAPGAMRFVVLRKLESGNCLPYQRPDQARHGEAAYRRQVDAFAAAIRDVNSGPQAGPLTVIIEPDIMASMGCIPRWAWPTRRREIAYAIGRLAGLPATTTYLDAGAADWWGWRSQLPELRRVGIRRIRGFALNVTHYAWTRDTVAYGHQLARRLGVHFVVSTGRAGGGPITPALRRAGYEGGCNIPNAGLGPPPSTATASRWVDAYLWLLNPGFSDGSCRFGRNYRTDHVMWSDRLALQRIARRCQQLPRCYGRGPLRYHQ